MRLIDADKVILEIVHKYGREQGDAILEIDNAPVVDAVSIVRCKDCKYNYNTCINHGKMNPRCDFTDYFLTENDYCSRGERRHEDGD